MCVCGYIIRTHIRGGWTLEIHIHLSIHPRTEPLDEPVARHGAGGLHEPGPALRNAVEVEEARHLLHAHRLRQVRLVGVHLCLKGGGGEWVSVTWGCVVRGPAGRRREGAAGTKPNITDNQGQAAKPPN